MNTVAKISPSNSIIVRMANRFGVDPDKMLVTLKATAFKGDVSNEQMMGLMMVAEQYCLNPWTREIYAFPDRNNGIVPVVGVDGWSRIINSHDKFDGMEFNEGPLDAKNIPEWIECIIYRKDRSHPIKTKEYFAEVYRDNAGPWKSHPRRMLRHKSMIQCARLAFGFVGVYDPDEAERIIEVQSVKSINPQPFGIEHVPDEKTLEWVQTISNILSSDHEGHEIATMLRDADLELTKFDALYTAVLDKLAADKIISKANYRKYLKIEAPATIDSGEVI